MVRFTEWLKQNEVALTDIQESLARRIDHSSNDFACVALLTGPAACRNKILLNQWLNWREHQKESTRAATQEG
jgi:hypothetical protein